MKLKYIISGLLGIDLFFLVLSVLYSLIYASPDETNILFVAIIPIIVLSGFFIFLVAAGLVAISIYKSMEK